MTRGAYIENEAIRQAHQRPKYRPLDYMQVARRVEKARERHPLVNEARLNLIRALQHYPEHLLGLNSIVNAHYLLGHSDGWDECAATYSARFRAMSERARRFEWGHVLVTVFLMIFGAIGWLT